MSTQLDPNSVPVELRGLGEFSRLFESSGQSVGATIARGLFPMPFAVAMIVAAEIWLKPRDWKYYLVAVAGAAMFLNGLRVVIQALRRRRQKFGIFEHGFALWRNDKLKVYKWEQIEEVDASPQFFGFTMICRTDEGRRDKIHFNTSTDPLLDHRELWREVEEHSARARIPSVMKTIADDEEAEFVRRIWGKIVGTRIGVSRMGVTAKPRYGTSQFIHWSEVETVNVEGEELCVTEKCDSSSWISVPLLDMPGYVALVAAADQSQRVFLEQMEQVERERLPAAFAAIEAGDEVTIGNIGVSIRGLRLDPESPSWDSVSRITPNFDHIAVDAGTGKLRLDYGPLSLADRIMLYSVVLHARYAADPDNADDDGDDFDDEDDEI